MKKEMTCISCPVGCRLTAYEKDGKIIIEGNACKRGEVYGISEMTNPSRMVCSTVKIQGAFLPSLPVKTDEPVPKEKIFEVMEEINKIIVQAPVHTGQILIPHVAGTKSNIVATREM